MAEGTGEASTFVAGHSPPHRWLPPPERSPQLLASSPQLGGGRGAIAVLGALTRSPLQQWLRVGGTPAHPAEANTHNTRRREIPAGFRPQQGRGSAVVCCSIVRAHNGHHHHQITPTTHPAEPKLATDSNCTNVYLKLQHEALANFQI